eukprot:14808509-Alexandrium_andersonii.AAC.1
MTPCTRNDAVRKESRNKARNNTVCELPVLFGVWRGWAGQGAVVPFVDDQLTAAPAAPAGPQDD